MTTAVFLETPRLRPLVRCSFMRRLALPLFSLLAVTLAGSSSSAQEIRAPAPLWAPDEAAPSPVAALPGRPEKLHVVAPAQPSEHGSTTFAAYRAQALGYLTAQGITQHKQSGGARGRTFELYHLPDGTPAFPLPLHLNEKDTLRLHVVVPQIARTEFGITACEDVPIARVLSSYSEVIKTVGPAERDATPAVPFTLISHTRSLQCAGSLSYKITTTLPGGISATSTTSTKIEPVYLLLVGAALVFDFGRPVRYELNDRTKTGAAAKRSSASTGTFRGSVRS